MYFCLPCARKLEALHDGDVSEVGRSYLQQLQAVINLSETWVRMVEMSGWETVAD